MVKNVFAVDPSSGLVIPTDISLTGNGTPGVGVSAKELGTGYDHTTVLTLGTGCVLPAIAGGASLGVGTLIYTLPAGVQAYWLAYMSVGITQTQGHINSNTPNVGLGTVVASGAISVLSGTGTFQDIMAGTNAANCTGTPTVNTAAPTAAATLIRNAAAAKTVFFNAAAAWAASGDPAAILTGTVVLAWQTMA